MGMVQVVFAPSQMGEALDESCIAWRSDDVGAAPRREPVRRVLEALRPGAGLLREAVWRLS